MVIRLLVVLEIRSGGPRCHQGPCSWEHECRKIKICENASCICWDVLLDKGKVWLAAGARWKARLLPRVWTGLDHLDSIVYNLSKQTNKLKWPKLQGLTNLVFSEVCTSITFQRANEVKLGLNKSQHGAFFWQIDQLSWFEFTQKAIVRFCHIITKCQLSVIRPQNTGHIWWICSWFQLLSGELPVPLIVFGINHSYIHLLSVITIISWKKRERRRFLCWIIVLMRCQQWICDGVSVQRDPVRGGRCSSFEKAMCIKPAFQGICKCRETTRMSLLNIPSQGGNIYKSWEHMHAENVYNTQSRPTNAETQTQLKPLTFPRQNIPKTSVTAQT